MKVANARNSGVFKDIYDKAVWHMSKDLAGKDHSPDLLRALSVEVEKASVKIISEAPAGKLDPVAAAKGVVALVTPTKPYQLALAAAKKMKPKDDPHRGYDKGPGMR